MPPKKDPTPSKALVDAIAEHISRHAEDPLDRLNTVDVHTLNVIGEIALGESDEGTFTPEELATSFHAHLERIFRNRVCDEDANRQNMIGCLALTLRLVAISGDESRARPGYIPIGTVLIKSTTRDGEKAFSFIRHPNAEQIYRC